MAILSLLIGCAAPPPEEGEALAALLESNRASLASLTAPAVPATPAGRPAPAAFRPADAASSGLVSAAQLLGAMPEALRRWLGEPELRRPEGPAAEVWLYAGESCALDIILYGEGGSLRVAHAAARASGTLAQTEADCLRQLSAAGAAAARRGSEPGPFRASAVDGLDCALAL